MKRWSFGDRGSGTIRGPVRAGSTEEGEEEEEEEEEEEGGGGVFGSSKR